MSGEDYSFDVTIFNSKRVAYLSMFAGEAFNAYSKFSPFRGLVDLVIDLEGDSFYRYMKEKLPHVDMESKYYETDEEFYRNLWMETDYQEDIGSAIFCMFIIFNPSYELSYDDINAMPILEMIIESMHLDRVNTILVNPNNLTNIVFPEFIPDSGITMVDGKICWFTRWCSFEKFLR